MVVDLSKTDTTANTLCQATYRTATNPHIYRRLKEELMKAMPMKDSEVSVAQFEALPYLVRSVRIHPLSCIDLETARCREGGLAPWRFRTWTSQKGCA